MNSTLTLICPYCSKDMSYMEDKCMEELGYYSFKCDTCKEEFLAPQNNPLIRRIDHE